MTAPAIHRELPPLADVQEQIDATPHGRLTLDPARNEATSLLDLVRHVASGSAAEKLEFAAAAVAQAQLDNFPENLFWDFDCFLATIHRHASLTADYGETLSRLSTITVSLMQLYGQQSHIRFRYVHDFNYGFDWARWVRRDPDTRHGTDPFGVPFLLQSESRGRDILRLIAEDDEFYSRLTPGASRNPFPFPREPRDELLLYRDLAERDLIPVRAWSTEAVPAWEQNFDALRRERATALELDGSE